MSLALDRSVAGPFVGTSPRLGLLATAGLTSIGAGAIHAAAIGVHAEHRPTAIAFTVLATAQICWGGLALVKSNRIVGALGVVLGLGAFAGWLLAKTAGISFIEGLEVAEPVQWADGLCAGMALTGGLFAAVSLRPRKEGASLVPQFPMSIVAIAVTALSVAGMVTASTHNHAHGETGVETAGADGHDHAHEASTAGATTATTMGQMSGMDHGHDATSAAADAHPAVKAVPYDPTKPIDLSGTPGVTPEQQAFAENTIAVTLHGLPQWADYKVAEAAGFVSIGDGFTGTEHFVNQKFMDNPTILDPNEPESLVYDTSKGGKVLEAAMYMTQTGSALEDVPKDGGALMQWHIHNNLCYTPAGKVAGLTNAKGECAAGLVKPPNTPMIHVWIRPNPCGPFAALEGVGAGQILPGETRLCDTAHGGH